MCVTPPTVIIKYIYFILKDRRCLKLDLNRFDLLPRGRQRVPSYFVGYRVGEALLILGPAGFEQNVEPCFTQTEMFIDFIDLF